MAALKGFRETFILVIFFTLAQVHETEMKWVEDNLDTASRWVFITRFCFLSSTGKSKGKEGGLLNYYLRYPKTYAPQQLVFYYDVPGQWDSVYDRDLTCKQKIDVLQGRNQFTLTDQNNVCKTQTFDGVEHYVCEGEMDFSSARERWWFVVITRCGPPANSSANGLKLYYKLHMTNGDDLLHQEFSADEFYILPVDIIFFILYIILLVLSIICAVVLKKRQLLHTTYKMYMVAVTIWTLHLFCMVIAWGSYGTTGWEVRQLEVFGRILQALSNIIFILMLILMAKGYTIVRGRLTNKAVLKITIFINLYIIASVVLFIWEGAMFDPGFVLYYYESPPGYGMVAIILIGWLWFTKAAIFTLKHFKSKTFFYIAFYTIYSVWFWAGPIVILIAMFAMAKWTREKTVNGVQQFIAYLGHLIFLILTLPHKVNDNFPYHIRTTQIGTMGGEGDGDSQEDSARNGNNDDGFTSIGPNLELFITTKGQTSSEPVGRAYSPLDPSRFDTNSNDSPPPSYPMALKSGNALPPIGNKARSDGNINYNKKNSSNLFPSNNPNNNNNDLDPLGQRNNHLPPLRRALRENERAEEEITLPPIRGTGLPSIIPENPQAEATAESEDASPAASPTEEMFKASGRKSSAC